MSKLPDIVGDVVTFKILDTDAERVLDDRIVEVLVALHERVAEPHHLAQARGQFTGMTPAASRSANCSATANGAWLGSMMPPAPTRIVLVASAAFMIASDVAELAMPGML